MKKSNIVLYGASLPAILLLITPVGLIPVGYNLVLNFLVLFPAIWIMNKRINGKLMLKTILLSWLIAMGGMILGFIFSLMDTLTAAMLRELIHHIDVVAFCPKTSQNSRIIVSSRAISLKKSCFLWGIGVL